MVRIFVMMVASTIVRIMMTMVGWPGVVIAVAPAVIVVRSTGAAELEVFVGMMMTASEERHS